MTDAGHDQFFYYDGLDRVIRSTLDTATTNYEYDLSSNRRQAGPDTFEFNRAGQAVEGPDEGAFAHDRFGNITTNAEDASGTVSYDYDAADRLVSITAGSTTTTIALDALGRMRTRTIGSADPIEYSYLGDTETVVRIDDTATSGSPLDLDSALGPDGARILLKQTSPSSATGWLIPDLHANVAAVLTTGGAVSAAIRYDAYGVEVGTPYTTASAPGLAFRYQGRLDVADGTGAPDLYDMSARNYSPGLGAFTSLDTVMGSAADPISMNRYLYAHANPWSLVDPTGHWFEDFDPLGFLGEAADNRIAFGQGLVEGGAGVVTSTAEGLVGFGRGAVAAGGCMLDGDCRDRAIASAGRTLAAVAQDSSLV